jgi:hypothetical protein
VTPQGRQGAMDHAQLARYRELLKASDADDVHELIARHGAEILSRDLPYLVVAVRNTRRSALRRGAERYETPTKHPPEVADLESVWDPVARVIAHEGLRELASAMAELAPQDVLVLWAHASGHSDQEIVRQWEELGFTPPHPSSELIRKRRERAGARLRGLVVRERSQTHEGRGQDQPGRQRSG